MLKHSISHYGSSSGGLPTLHPIQHPLTSSSHSGDGSASLHRDHRDRSHSHTHLLPHDPQTHHHQGTSDPSRFLEVQGHVSPQQTHSHSQSYLDHSYPSIHTSRPYLDTSRTSRGQGQGHYAPHHHPHHHHQSRSSQPPQSSYNTPTSPQPKVNGNIFLTSPHHPPDHGGSAQIPNCSAVHHHHSAGAGSAFRQGVLRSLALLSILSLLLALNSLIFLLKIVWPLNMSGGGSDSEFKLMYEVTLCLAAMCLSISLCVLLVTSAQYFFAISGSPGTTSFLHKVTLIRAGATGGFFLSIPLFLAAIVLYTFTHLSFAVPALVTTGIVGLAIVFGGCAMVYHVFTWQKEKTNKKVFVQDVSPNPTLELSTLV